MDFVVPARLAALGIAIALAGSAASSQTKPQGNIASEKQGEDLRKALGDEISRTKIRCALKTNTAGYNADGYANFRSFLNGGFVVQPSSGVVNFKASTPPSQDIVMKVNLSPDLMKIADFHVTADELTVTRVRQGTLVDPRYEEVTNRKRTFDLFCTAQP